MAMKTARPSRDNHGGISSAAVQAATGKSWKQWCALLDKAGCNKMTHKEIVAVVRDKHGAGSWWRQMVTVGYEQAKGLREKHEKPAGFEISRSKTIAVPANEAFAAWRDPRSRTPWLGKTGLTIRTSTRDKTLRINWTKDGSNLEVRFYPKGSSKTQVTIQHGKLADAETAEKMKTYWSKSLARLQAYLEA